MGVVAFALYDYISTRIILELFLLAYRHWNTFASKNIRGRRHIEQIEVQNKKGNNNIYGTKSRLSLRRLLERDIQYFCVLLRQAIKTAVQNKIIPKIRIHMYANTI